MTPILKKYWFILALFVAVALAFQFPEWGQRGGKLHSETTTEFGIILVFLIQGWLLPTEVLARCVFNWKVHLFIQLFVFLVFPLLALGGDNLWGPVLPQNLRTGFFFLAVLPTTITSAVIYTSQAGGNTATALANTTISNLAGVVITPLWMTLLVSSAGTTTGDLGPVFWKLTKLILIPSFFGQIGHLFCKSALPYIRTPGQYLNQSIIIFIVFAAFSNSVAGGVWKGQGADIVVTTSFICLVLYAVGNGLSLWSSRVLGFSVEDRPAIFYCSTQKTLAAAVPLGTSLFGSDPAFGIILLPVMIYHPIQLILGAFLFSRFRKQAEPGGQVQKNPAA